jgi:hypothetical protein
MYVQGNLCAVSPNQFSATRKLQKLLLRLTKSRKHGQN